ncbi:MULTISPECIES: TetR family transcriptional regulator [unclassified Streptomyces]|uniref:TetR family transcriptional regulator n=1 Tax=unclassified Streptomyces TaxID=2593676 RepID=UPI0005F992C2|nr:MULTISPECIES: TetR family transcriptional regulator [unclassified Streptomyces]KJY28107.1 TetR family transcriptional regulator [Streptomyces sp. NRRL S-495]KOV17648.1 TetR family transcriptional regulator [Streptomyces sp. XY431]
MSPSEPEPGLRTLKKQRTRQTIADVAIALFLDRGFAQVSVAEIAAAAEVSKPTLFRYFATKEELVLHRFADHLGEAGRVVRDRAAGLTPLDALERHHLAGLAAHEPQTGLTDDPEVLAFLRLVYETPELSAQLLDYVDADADALAEALDPAGGITARLFAAQYVAVRQVLARTAWARLADGQDIAEAGPQAVAETAAAFALLRDGARAQGF